MGRWTRSRCRGTWAAANKQAVRECCWSPWPDVLAGSLEGMSTLHLHHQLLPQNSWIEYCLICLLIACCTLLQPLLPATTGSCRKSRVPFLVSFAEPPTLTRRNSCHTKHTNQQ